MDSLDVRRQSYTRHRDARVALIRCGSCNEYYDTSVRQARRIRKGESRRLCQLCRNLENALDGTPDEMYKYMMWWLEDSGLSRQEVLEIAFMIFLEEEHLFEEEELGAPTVSPIGRLPSEEGNRTNGHGPAVRVVLRGNSLTVDGNAAA